MCPCSSTVGRSALASPCSAPNPRCTGVVVVADAARRRVREQHVDPAPGASRSRRHRAAARSRSARAACCASEYWLGPAL